MNPQQDQTPGLRLPQPSFDTGQSHTVTPYEQQPASVPVVSGVQQPMPSNNLDTPLSTQSDDEATLDQEWVAKAREVILRTHSDPFMQSQELSKVKSQYIKVRYNKDIKTAE